MKIKRINLIPRKDLHSIRFMSSQIIAITCLAVLAGVFVKGFTTFYFLNQISRESAELESLVSSKAIQLNRARNAETAHEEKTAKAGSIKSAKEDAYNWSKRLKELSLLTPKNVWLSSLKKVEEKDGGGRLVIMGGAYSQQDVTQLFAALRKSYYFRESEFRSSEKTLALNPQIYQFQIESWIGAIRK